MKNKKFLFISLLILAIGFAAVSTTLYISGNLVFGTNKEDFDIYFSKAYLDDIDIYEDVISEDKKTITFTTKNLKTIGDSSILEYQVMNNSREYDATLTVNCSLSDNKYVSYTNTLNDTILAQTVEDGVLVVTLDKVSTEEVTETLTCSLVYNAVERTSQADLYDENTYVLSGYLQDEEGNALTNQNLVVYSETPHITTTNSLGYFYVENLLNEKHEIYITNKTVNELEGMTKEEVIESSLSKGTFKVTDELVSLDNNYKLDKEKIVISSNFNKTCADLVGTVYNYDYTGGEQTLETPCTGTYKLETWGAQGGGYSTLKGGYGGYSTGNMLLNKDDKLYIYSGGSGLYRKANQSPYTIAGGYNGGGIAYDSAHNENRASGGGATHIAVNKNLGELKNYVDNRNDIVMVAGGGGGATSADGGHAGGIRGMTGTATSGYTIGTGGTQTSGGVCLKSNYYSCTSSINGLFGKGGNSVRSSNSSTYGGSGGGAGYYGGAAGYDNGSGAGGSGYIGNSNLTNKAMYCYNCETSDEESTKTISTTCTSATPTENCAKQGNGYARITLVSLD